MRARLSTSGRCLAMVAVALMTAGCGQNGSPDTPSSTPPASVGDGQHEGITTPHGDHTPHHGGMVLMNGELHYEIVFDAEGRHRLWFTNAIREDLPASIARDVAIVVTRPGEAPENVPLQIDEAGESWVANGRPVNGDDVMVKISYSVQGAPHEVEIPFIPPAR